MTDYARGMGVKIIAASALLLLTACGSPGGNSVSEPATSTTAAMTTLSPATPQYSVIGTTAMSTMRYDGEPIYYVAMDPVNLTNDGFKQNVKLVTQALAKTKGDPDFSARLFDDRAVAAETFARVSDPPLSQKPDETTAAKDREGQHLVAIYSGGLATTPDPYVLMWYPDAVTGTPNVGHYVDSEPWKPQV